MQIGAAVVIHVHAAIGVLVQVSTQHSILLYGGQIVARLIASAMCVYGFVLMIHSHAMLTEGIQEPFFVVKVSAGRIHDNTAMRHRHNMTVYGLHFIQHGMYGLAGCLKLLGIAKFGKVIVMTTW